MTPQLILQPAGSVESKRHFNNTVLTPVPLSRVAEFLRSEEVKRLQLLFPEGNACVWGVTPGINTAKWKKLQQGDVAVFAGGMRLFSAGTVVHTIHSKSLAFDLWGQDHQGQTWEHIYFLDNVRKVDIPYATLNAHLGYAQNAIVQGFNVVPWTKTKTFINYLHSLGITRPPHDPSQNTRGVPPESIPDRPIDAGPMLPISTAEYEAVFVELDPNEPLDAAAIVQIRKEQSLLRDYLFKNKLTAICGICGREFPVDMVVAAHIKRRCDCSEEEKRDYPNNVMPICKMGCDDLFEKGYISISKGRVVRCADRFITYALKGYIDILHNNSCLYSRESNQKYFEWHLANRFRK